MWAVFFQEVFMELTGKKVSKKLAGYNQVVELLKRAFPPKELLPMYYLNFLSRRRYAEFLAYYHEDEFVGLSFVIFTHEMAYVLYLAINDKVRSRGYGGQILSLIAEKYSDKVITLNIEKIDPEAPNYQQRLNRERFYLKNGYSQTGYYNKIYRQDFDILATGEFVEDDFKDIFKKLTFGLSVVVLYRTSALK